MAFDMFRCIVTLIVVCWAVPAQASLIAFNVVVGRTTVPPIPSDALVIEAQVDTGGPELTTINELRISILDVDVVSFLPSGVDFVTQQGDLPSADFEFTVDNVEDNST